MIGFIVNVLTLIVSIMTFGVSLMNNQNKTLDIPGDLPKIGGMGGSGMAVPSESGSESNNMGEGGSQAGSSLVSRSGLNSFRMSPSPLLRSGRSGLMSMKRHISKLESKN